MRYQLGCIYFRIQQKTKQKEKNSIIQAFNINF